MLKLKIGRLLELHETLVIERGHFERAEHELRQKEKQNQRYQLKPADFNQLRDHVAEVADIAGEARLIGTHQAASRMTEALAHIGGVIPPDAIVAMGADECGKAFRHLMDICSRLRDDCRARLYYQIAPENAELLESKAHFGAAVERLFGSGDILEAAACLAFERGTASVFHLMRALEAAVQIVADKIGATINDEHGKRLPWGVIAQNMKPKIDKMQKGRAEQIKWYRAQSHLETVNRAWRVPTAHPGETYTPSEARALFDATRSFMQELAALSDPLSEAALS